VLWKGTFEKKVTLNYQNHPKWIRWDLDTTFPSAWSDSVFFAINAGTLVADFSKLYAFDAQNDRLSEDKQPKVPDNGDQICTWGREDTDLQPNVGGVIAARPDGKYAIGVYHHSGNGFTNDDAFGLCAWKHGDGGQYGVKTYAWQVYHAVGSVDAGTYSYTVYMAVGTLQNVRDEMVAMKDAGL
jgi:hypothetical protein